MKYTYLMLSAAFLIGSIIASNLVGLLAQGSLFLIGLGCFILSFKLDK